MYRQVSKYTAIGRRIYSYCMENIQLLHGEYTAITRRKQNHLRWDDDGARFAIDQHAEFNFHCDRSLKTTVQG